MISDEAQLEEQRLAEVKHAALGWRRHHVRQRHAVEQRRDQHDEPGDRARRRRCRTGLVAVGNASRILITAPERAGQEGSGGTG